MKPPTTDPLSRRLCEKVKVLRKNQNWTLEILSAASGVSRSMLSQIERGKANPTLAVAGRIASAFGISISELVEEPWSESSIQVIRHSDPGHLYRNDGKCRIRTLSPLSMEKTVEFYELSISPNKELSSAAHFNGTREILTIEKGIVEIQSGTDHCTLRKGDSAHYRADLDHIISNCGKGEAICFMVVVYI